MKNAFGFDNTGQKKSVLIREYRLWTPEDKYPARQRFASSRKRMESLSRGKI